MSRRSREIPVYKERFGSSSPEDYMNLRIMNFDSSLKKEDIREGLQEQLRTFGRVEIRIMNDQHTNERVIYVNFDRRDAAKTVRKHHMERLKNVLGRRIIADPAGVVQDLKHNDKKNQQQETVWNLKTADKDATRTLFVGNLPADIRESELRKVFERHGNIEDIEVKKPMDTNASYAFVVFQTIESAINAMKEEHDTPIRQGTRRCKIGYGKSQVSRRLWVGGLGAWTSTELLTKEFDRYGLIDRLDYDDGAEFAYIRFADQQAALDAMELMDGFALGGKDHCIIVDYAKDSLRDTRKRRASTELDLDENVDCLLKTVEQLHAEVACTWIGHISLKKNEYSIRAYRIAGSERLLQLTMRDEDGNPKKLLISQRIGVVDSVERRLLDTGRRDRAMMIAIPHRGNRDDLRPLVNYLQEKRAAGVVSLENETMYVFAPSETSTKLISAFAPKVQLFTTSCNYLLLFLMKSSLG